MDESCGDVTENLILGGRVRLRQPAKGYRAGMDAALLAAACDAKPGETVIEAGCGVGAVMLAAARRREGASFVGVEREEAALALAQENVLANGLADRVQARGGDVNEPPPGLFDAGLANPPFFDDPTRLRAPHPAKQAAWMAEGGLESWARYLLKAIRDGGSITLIHRADRLADLLGLLAPKAGSIQIRPVHPFAEAPASRIIVRARKGGRAPLRLLAPLILHEHGGAKHTAQAEAILRGEADLPW
jgi:tRNA1(Val) A37 N6-methylase TrmN6